MQQLVLVLTACFCFVVEEILLERYYLTFLKVIEVFLMSLIFVLMIWYGVSEKGEVSISMIDRCGTRGKIILSVKAL